MTKENPSPEKIGEGFFAFRRNAASVLSPTILLEFFARGQNSWLGFSLVSFIMKSNAPEKRKKVYE
jgi:hypothetical protein